MVQVGTAGSFQPGIRRSSKKQPANTAKMMKSIAVVLRVIECLKIPAQVPAIF